LTPAQHLLGVAEILAHVLNVFLFEASRPRARAGAARVHTNPEKPLATYCLLKFIF
jgi:hypothetical protein